MRASIVKSVEVPFMLGIYVKWFVISIFTFLAVSFEGFWAIAYKYGEVWNVATFIFVLLSLIVAIVQVGIYKEPTAARTWLLVTQVFICLGLLKMFIFFGSPETIWVNETKGKVSPFFANPFKDTIVSLAKTQSTSVILGVRTSDNINLACTLTLTDFSIDMQSADWNQSVLALANTDNPNESIQASLASLYGNALNDTVFYTTKAEVMSQQANDTLAQRIKYTGARIPDRLGLNPRDGGVSVLCK